MGDRQGLMSTSSGIARFYGIRFVVLKMKVNVLTNLQALQFCVKNPLELARPQMSCCLANIRKGQTGIFPLKVTRPLRYDLCIPSLLGFHLTIAQCDCAQAPSAALFSVNRAAFHHHFRHFYHVHTF